MRAKIGDRVLVHGHVDEIRKDTVIIRNDGGYFGTIWNEILVADNFVLCRDCKHWKNKHLCEALSRYGSFDTNSTFYCGFAERRTDD